MKGAHRFEALELIRQALREQFGSFFCRAPPLGYGGATIHGSVYLSDDFRNEIRFVGREFSTAFVRQREGNGCIECLSRTLKKQLLWVRHFRNRAELRDALVGFRQRYNEQWILERLRYRTPAQARRDFS